MSIDYVAMIRDESAALVDAARQGPLDAPVAGCPGWDVTRLVGHIARTQEWMTRVVRSGGEDRGASEERPPRDASVIEWFEARTAELVEAMAGLDPDQPMWSFTGTSDVAGFWPRRAAHEVAVHRWDAQQAVGLDPKPMDPAVAADGVDEFLRHMLPNQVAGKDLALDGTIHVHATDAEGEWMLRAADGQLVVEHGHGKGDVALRGPAEALLLALWRRVPLDHPGLEIFGDREALARFVASY